MADRYQFVEVKHHKPGSNNSVATNFQSKIKKIQTGVPQGSILGPLLFIIFVNDITLSVPGDKLITYADDTTILNTGKNVRSLEIDTYVLVNRVANYFHNIGMVINSLKSQYIIFKTKTQNNSNNYIDIFLDDNKLEEVESTKFLGVTVDSRLNWNEHIDQLSTKLASGLYIIRNISKLGNKQLTLNCYYAFIYSQITYSILLWGSSSNKNINRIFLLQKRAIRYLENLKPLESCRNSFIKNNILTVPSIYIYECILYNRAEKTLTITKTHTYGTRNTNFAESHRTKLFETKPTYIGKKMYHNLPQDVKSDLNNPCFKIKLKSWLVQQCFYSINDFLFD